MDPSTNDLIACSSLGSATQAATPPQPGVVGNHQPTDHDQNTPLLVFSPRAPISVEPIGDNSDMGGESNPASDASDEDEDDEGGMDSPQTSEAGAPSSMGSTSYIVNQPLPGASEPRRAPRIIPDTPHDAAVSSVAQRLRDTEAEPAAIEYLCNGVFPGGTITLEALKAPISAQEAAQFQV